MNARRILTGALVGWLMLSSAAAAKEFKPGDLSVCNAKRCVSIRSRPALNALASFYYDSARSPTRARAPRLGTPFFRLEFSNGYVTGIAAGTQLNRFHSYGVNLEQFQKRAWYRVPPRAAVELRRLTAGLTPLRLSAAALMDTGTFDARSASATQMRPRARRSATSSHGGSPLWALGAVPLALALLARHRRRSAPAGLHASGAD